MQNYAENPFEISGIERVEGRRKRKQGEEQYEVYSKDDGVQINVVSQYESCSRLVDTLPYVKAFRSGILKRLKNMSQPACNMYLYILENLGVGRTSIHITDKSFLVACGYSPSSRSLYYTAVQELLERGILARKTGSKNEFWINPNVIFNGDRTRLLKAI